MLNVLLVDSTAASYSTCLDAAAARFHERHASAPALQFAYRSSPETGLQYLNDHEYVDLLITEMTFSGHSRIEFLATIKERYPTLPVILFSHGSDLAAVKAAGFDTRCHPDTFIEKARRAADTDEECSDSCFDELLDSALALMRRFGKIPVRDGVLVTHGTDTMAWAFAILRYGLYNLRTNVVITGSQLPLEGAFSPSDAIGNLLTSVKLLNLLVPPNVVQVFNDGVHIFNKNLNKVKKWSFDAFAGDTFGRIDSDELRIAEEDVYPLTKANRLERLYFIRTGGTIDAVKGTEGLEGTGDFTEQYLRQLGERYFVGSPVVEKVNPKDSSLLNPLDWVTLLHKIAGFGVGEADTGFDWRILPVLLSPLLTADCYAGLARMVIDQYAGAVVLGYGAGNVNIFDSAKSEGTRLYARQYAAEFGVADFEKQAAYSFIPFLRAIEHHNREHPDDYRCVVMSSQVPIDCYDIDYQAGRIPLYYGAVPGGELSYPEAQVKLAFLLGHKAEIQAEAARLGLSYEQLLKAAFLSGVRFNKSSSRLDYLRLSERECGCRLSLLRSNPFVKKSFEDAIREVAEQLARQVGTRPR